MGIGVSTATGFGSSSTAAQVARDIRLDGKNVVITGANAGIGKVTAIQLARMGANVFIACRDPARAAQAESEIKEQSGSNKVQFMQLDLSSFDSVRSFASAFKQLNLPLHLLINNAGTLIICQFVDIISLGVMAMPYQISKDGWEMQFQTNHLGHFLLTNLLLDNLKKGAPARVVNVSSQAHHLAPGWFSKVPKEMINSYADYFRWSAYGVSKVSNILFAKELNRRYAPEGVTSYALHPGVINTELMRYHFGASIWHFVSAPFVKSVEQGAATTGINFLLSFTEYPAVYVATAPEIDEKQLGGEYFMDCNIHPASQLGCNETVAKELWEQSLTWTGLRKASSGTPHHSL